MTGRTRDCGCIGPTKADGIAGRGRREQPRPRRAHCRPRATRPAYSPTTAAATSLQSYVSRYLTPTRDPQLLTSVCLMCSGLIVSVMLVSSRSCCGHMLRRVRRVSSVLRCARRSTVGLLYARHARGVSCHHPCERVNVQLMCGALYLRGGRAQRVLVRRVRVAYLL